MLYIISTPIGNLGDITIRALETLKECDLLFCEDTRRTRILLNHYQIDKPLKSYHLHNEKRRMDEVVEALVEGKKVGLVSDAGTPLISDPGEMLVKRCRDLNLPVTALPGPSALTCALTLSGFNTETFQFIGFLPKKSGQLERVLRSALSYEGTTIAYETPHRIFKSLTLLAKLAPEQPIAIAREMTKKFEQVKIGTPLSLLESCPTKGEIVLLIAN